MIYRNEDSSVYKIEKVPQKYGGGSFEKVTDNSLGEIIEVLNYLLEEIKDIKEGKNEPIKPAEPSEIPGSKIY